MPSLYLYPRRSFPLYTHTGSWFECRIVRSGVRNIAAAGVFGPPTHDRASHHYYCLPFEHCAMSCERYPMSSSGALISKVTTLAALTPRPTYCTVQLFVHFVDWTRRIATRLFKVAVLLFPCAVVHRLPSPVAGPYTIPTTSDIMSFPGTTQDSNSSKTLESSSTEEKSGESSSATDFSMHLVALDVKYDGSCLFSHVAGCQGCGRGHRGYDRENMEICLRPKGTNAQGETLYSFWAMGTAGDGAGWGYMSRAKICSYRRWCWNSATLFVGIIGFVFSATLYTKRCTEYRH